MTAVSILAAQVMIVYACPLQAPKPRAIKLVQIQYAKGSD